MKFSKYNEHISNDYEQDHLQQYDSAEEDTDQISSESNKSRRTGSRKSRRSAKERARTAGSDGSADANNYRLYISKLGQVDLFSRDKERGARAPKSKKMFNIGFRGGPGTRLEVPTQVGKVPTRVGTGSNSCWNLFKNHDFPLVFSLFLSWNWKKSSLAGCGAWGGQI